MYHDYIALLFVPKYYTSGLVVIAQILVWSNEDLDAV